MATHTPEEVWGLGLDIRKVGLACRGPGRDHGQH